MCREGYIQSQPLFIFVMFNSEKKKKKYLEASGQEVRGNRRVGVTGG